MHRLPSLIFLTIILFLIGCEKIDNITEPPNQNDNASVNFYFSKPNNLDSLVITAKAMVSASDLDTIIQDLKVTANSVEGIIQNIPAGPDRKFEIFTYDAKENLTYYGYTVSDVLAESVITLHIILYPVNNTGNVIIVGTFAPFPPRPGKIVFEADYNGLYDIYIMNADASEITNLTNSPNTDDLRPRISPDKQKILFTRKFPNGLHRPYIMNIDGSDLHELNFLPEINAAPGDWSPDMKKIVINAGFPDSANIYIYNLITNSTFKLTNTQSTKGIASWSPSGQWIAYQSNESGIYRIYMIQPDGSNKHTIISQSPLEEKRPQFSPDGTEILFTGRDISGAWDLFIVVTTRPPSW